MEESEKALEYIFDTTEVRSEIAQIIGKIENPTLQGIIFAKYNSAQEAKIKFELSSNSYMKSIPNNIKVQDMVSILGNLLENSIEELKGKKDGWIFLEIRQEENLKIVVKNNGAKIPDDMKENIFKRGFSTKEGERGLGLYSINEIIEASGGKLTLKSQSITEWIVEI